MISYLRPWLEKEYLGPGFVSMSPLSSAMRKTSQISSSKFHVISKYATLQIYDLIINTLSLFFFFFFFFFVVFFFDEKAKSQKKNGMKTRVSYLVKQNLQHIHSYDGATIEQQIELLKIDLKFFIKYSYLSTLLNQTNRHRRNFQWKLETLLEY